MFAKRLNFISQVVILILISDGLIAQNCSISGTVFDKSSNTPIQYANAILTSPTDSSLLLGAITNEKGIFLIDGIKEGTYNLKLSFIGYETVTRESISIQKGQNKIDPLIMDVLKSNLEEVTVRSTRQAITYKVDKKVINASSFPSAEAGMDLLENVPSVQVDFEGRLTYRGDGTFKVFINGHPVQNGEEKLRQIPADKIDKIEIITNPSAKYHAEGTAGIIQVILKRNRLQGYAINASATASTLNSFLGNITIDQKGEKGGWYIEGDIRRQVFNKYSYNEIRTTVNNNEYQRVESEFDNKNLMLKDYYEFGCNYDITPNDYIDFSIYANLIKSQENRNKNGNTTESLFRSDILVNEDNYRISSEKKTGYRYFGTTLTYEHTFNKEKTKTISSFLDFTYLPSLNEEIIDTKIFESHTDKKGMKGSEQREIIFEGNLSYQDEFTEKTSVEVGVNFTLDHIPSVNSSNGTFDEQNNLTPYHNEPLNKTVNFKQDVYASFLTIKSGWGKLNIQAGLRCELTDRKSDYSYNEPGETRITTPSSKRFVDFFPTLHTLYNFSDEHQLGINYSRRIKRPDYWRLIPLEEYSSPYEYGIGNGALLPEYSNSFEVVYKKSWDKDFIGFELFSKNITNVMQRYYRYDTGNIVMATFENVGYSWSSGAEIMFGIDLFKWWNLNTSSSIYDYRLTVDIEDSSRTETQLYNKSRINNTFLLPKGFTFKWDVNYNSPAIKVQYRQDGYFSSNMSIQKGFKENTWRFTLSWTNIFNTIRFNIKTSGEHFTVKNEYHLRPYASFKISYNFDNQK